MHHIVTSTGAGFSVEPAEPSRLFLGTGSTGTEVVAIGAVADVELVAHDGPQHRMGAVYELAVYDGMETQVGRDGDRAAAVPTDAMTFFGGHDGRRAMIRRGRVRRTGTIGGK